MSPADKGLFIVSLLETIRNGLIIVLVVLVILAIRDQYIIWQLKKLDKLAAKYQDVSEKHSTHF